MQIGIPLKIVIIELPGDEVITLINTKIPDRRGQRIMKEACCNVLGYQGERARSIFVKVKAEDRHWKSHCITVEELSAQVLGQARDHIDGFLYADHSISTTNLPVKPSNSTL